MSTELFTNFYYKAAC